MFKRIRDFPRSFFGRLRLAWRLARDPDLLRRLDEYENVEVDADVMTDLVDRMFAPDTLAKDYVDPSSILLRFTDGFKPTKEDAKRVLEESRRAPPNSLDALNPKENK